MDKKRISRRGRDAWLAAGMAGLLTVGITGCKNHSADGAPIVSSNGGDPADGNMAQPYTGGTAGGYGTPASNTQVMGQSESYGGQASGESYAPTYNDASQGEAPIIRQAPPQGNGEAGPPPDYDAQGAPQQGYAGQGYGDQGYTDAEEAGAEAIADTDQAPPPLPEYDQPPAPDPNYLWTPGYWNYASAGYYWVPGVWCAPPFYGALWTPPWWGWGSNHWYFHRGYWGPHVGFYGGINYGFGYIGTGYFGGYWRGHDFVYNRAVTNVNINIVHNYYDRTVVYNNVRYGPHSDNRVSYNGGRGGIDIRPRPFEIAAMHEAHYAPEPAQRQVRLEAAADRGNFFRNDGGRPAQAFAARPIGRPDHIAEVPREEAFNRAAVRPGTPAVNPGALHAGAPNGNFGRPAMPSRTSGANPVNGANGAEHRPGGIGPEAGHGAPGAQNRPGEFNRGVNHPGAPAAPQPGVREDRAAPAPRETAPPAGHPGFGGGDAAPAPRRETPAPAARPEPQPQFRPQPQQRPEVQQRPEMQQRPDMQPRPEIQPRPEMQPRPEAAPRPEMEPRPAPQPSRAAPAFHPAPAPRPAPAAPHAGGEEHHR